MKKAIAVAATAMAVGASVLTAAAPAYASSGMTCSTSKSGNGYWFYCSGYQNLYGAWGRIDCVSVWGSHTHPSYTHNYTAYAPFSFGEYLDCGNSWFFAATFPEWGPS
jgi:hypothetical protein